MSIRHQHLRKGLTQERSSPPNKTGGMTQSSDGQRFTDRSCQCLGTKVAQACRGRCGDHMYGRYCRLGDQWSENTRGRCSFRLEHRDEPGHRGRRCRPRNDVCQCVSVLVRWGIDRQHQLELHLQCSHSELGRGVLVTRAQPCPTRRRGLWIVRRCVFNEC